MPVMIVSPCARSPSIGPSTILVPGIFALVRSLLLLLLLDALRLRGKKKRKKLRQANGEEKREICCRSASGFLAPTTIIVSSFAAHGTEGGDLKETEHLVPIRATSLCACARGTSALVIAGGNRQNNSQLAIVVDWTSWRPERRVACFSVRARGSECWSGRTNELSPLLGKSSCSAGGQPAARYKGLATFDCNG